MSRAPDDERFMRLALQQAHKGLGRTHPNPAVGAVIVKSGRVIATGYHARAGTAHAEANALLLSGKRAKGATIYSTLEPCDHFGRTPPCTQGILEAGIARVVYGSSDPNPLVDGKGVKRMRRAGLEIASGVYTAPRLTPAVRDRIWAVLEKWRVGERDDSVVMTWPDAASPGGQNIRALGEAPIVLTEVDSVVLARRPLSERELCSLTIMLEEPPF